MPATTYRHQLRKAYHRAVLQPIADHFPLQVDGQPVRRCIAVMAWKEWFRDIFHPGRSTEDLSDAELRTLMLQVQSFAATRLGVEFTNDQR